MTSIDIRGEVKDFVDQIYFSDKRYSSAYLISKTSAGVSIDTAIKSVYVETKEDAQNLIKALGKAIELGWWN